MYNLDLDHFRSYMEEEDVLFELEVYIQNLIDSNKDEHLDVLNIAYENVLDKIKELREDRG